MFCSAALPQVCLGTEAMIHKSEHKYVHDFSQTGIGGKTDHILISCDSTIWRVISWLERAVRREAGLCAQHSDMSFSMARKHCVETKNYCFRVAFYTNYKITVTKQWLLSHINVVRFNLLIIESWINKCFMSTNERIWMISKGSCSTGWFL